MSTRLSLSRCFSTPPNERRDLQRSVNILAMRVLTGAWAERVCAERAWAERGAERALRVMLCAERCVPVITGYWT